MVQDLGMNDHISRTKQAEIAKVAGTDPGHISRIFSGAAGPTGKRRTPSWEMACKIADAMSVSLDELRGMIGPGSDPATDGESLPG